MMFDDGKAVKLVPVGKIPGRGIIFNARGTEPLPDEFLPASQAFSLFSADDDGAGLGGVFLSHEVPSSIMWKKPQQILCRETGERKFEWLTCPTWWPKMKSIHRNPFEETREL
jgi:hypothetical protein